ncbi:MAG: DUF1638 domain-containing protein [Isosphaeraceae bacterium]
MRILLIGCEMLTRELCDAVAHAPHQVDLRTLSSDLHDRAGATLRDRLQREIDAADACAYETIALGYALCGNGLSGLTARSLPLVVPRAHDCITLLMGSRSTFNRAFHDNPGVYYRSIGWIERGRKSTPRVRDDRGESITRESLVERYGEADGSYLYQELTSYRSHYSQLTYIRTELDLDSLQEGEARAEAAEHGWRFEVQAGDLNLFRRLVADPWDAEAFLVVPPGHRIVPSYDDMIIRAEAAAP